MKLITTPISFLKSSHSEIQFISLIIEVTLYIKSLNIVL